MSERLRAPSAHQQAIFDFVQSGQGHGVIHATAGSGKTATLIEVSHYLSKGEHSLFLAFNLQVAAELRKRLPQHIQAQTLHALGFRLLRQSQPETSFKVEPSKLASLVTQIIREDDRSSIIKGAERKALTTYLKQLAHFIRLNLSTPEQVPALVKTYQQHLGDLEQDLRLVAHELVWKLLDAAAERAQQGVIDFTDMMFLPIIQNLLPKQGYDFVLIDEAQDLAPLSILLIQRVMKRKGRLLAVGDQHQAIYGFAGADVGGLKRLARHLGATDFPLSVTYRCPRSHIKLARRFSPQIAPAPMAGEGTVRYALVDDVAREIQPQDLVLCRLNAPLFELGLRCSSLGVPTHILGQDVIGQLERDVKAALFHDLTEAQRTIDLFVVQELGKIERSNLTVQEKTRALLQRRDELSSLSGVATFALGEGVTTRPELVRFVKELFASNRAAVFSSVHKAKGKEAERVFILYPHLMPLRGDDGTLLSGETCVQFVAVTRSKESLTFIEHPNERDGWWRT